MTKIERITANLAKDNSYQKDYPSHFSDELFIEHGLRYIKSIEEGRMICSIGSVSKSGMSRTIKFLECFKRKDISYGPKYQYLNYWSFFKANGFNVDRSDKDYFRISGTGMDMIFHTNYTIIHRLHRLGFISKAKCTTLSQMTPQVI